MGTERVISTGWKLADFLQSFVGYGLSTAPGCTISHVHYDTTWWCWKLSKNQYLLQNCRQSNPSEIKINQSNLIVANWTICDVFIFCSKSPIPEIDIPANVNCKGQTSRDFPKCFNLCCHDAVVIVSLFVSPTRRHRIVKSSKSVTRKCFLRLFFSPFCLIWFVPIEIKCAPCIHRSNCHSLPRWVIDVVESSSRLSAICRQKNRKWNTQK